jgi:hypothetical protein
MTNVERIEPECEPEICSICFKEIVGWSNNAEPINDGRCCKVCDDTIVIPARIRQFSGGKL